MNEQRQPDSAVDDAAEEVVDDGVAPDDDLVEGGPTQAGFDRSPSAVVPPVPTT